MIGKRKSAETKSEFDHEALVAVAEELNDLMFDEGQGINVEASDKKIAAGIIEAAAELTPEDKISAKTKEVLIDLGCYEPDEVEKTVVKKEEPEDKEEEPEDKEEEPPEEEDEGKEEGDLTLQIEKASKLSTLKELVNKYDELNKLRKGLDKYNGLAGTRELKAAVCKILGIDVKRAPAEKKEKAAKKKTRTQIMADIINTSMKKSSMTKAEIIAEMQKLYGGTERESKYQVELYVSLLLSLGLLKEKDDAFKYVVE